MFVESEASTWVSVTFEEILQRVKSIDKSNATADEVEWLQETVQALIAEIEADRKYCDADMFTAGENNG